MFRICKNAPLQWVPAGTYTPVPGPRLLRVGLCLRRWAGATREKKASEGSFNIIGTLYSSGRYRLTLPAEQVSSVSVESVHLRSRGHFLPRTRAPRPPRRRPKKQVPLVQAAAGRMEGLFCPGRQHPARHACMRGGRGQARTGCPRPRRERGASRGLLGGQEQRVGVFKPFKLRLVDPLEDVPVGTGQGRLDGPRETPARSSGCPAPAPHARPAHGHAPAAQDAPPVRQVLLVVRGQLHRLAGELRVEVVQAVVVCYLRLEGRQGLLLPQLQEDTRSDPRAPAQRPLGVCTNINHGIEQKRPPLNMPHV